MKKLAIAIMNMMKNRKPLFYREYEKFYTMATKSQVFQSFCEDAFGKDFSQDGFSDITQIDMMLQYIPDGMDCHILDIGCCNGKMLGYIQEKTNSFIYGFDYSKNAIKLAKKLYPNRSDFRRGIIGEIQYSESAFDLIVSMDTIYFAKDMKNFVAQVKTWLKPSGVFFIGYQEGDVMPKTESLEKTEIVKALEYNHLKYEALDITEQTYQMLRRKREAAKAYQEKFIEEGNKMWFDMLMYQTACSEQSYEDFARKMSRYIFVVRK